MRDAAELKTLRIWIVMLLMDKSEVSCVRSALWNGNVVGDSGRGMTG
jgi:hypothetical protein